MVTAEKPSKTGPDLNHRFFRPRLWTTISGFESLPPSHPPAALPLAHAVNDGFFCPSGLVHDPWLESIRADPAIAEILGHAEARHHEALEAFREATGDRLLGLTLTPGA
jgi:hypothetical protein